MSEGFYEPEYLDYDITPVVNGRYSYISYQPSGTNGSTITVNTGGVPISLPIDGSLIYNNALSTISFDLYVPAQGGGRHVWMLGGDCIPMFRDVAFNPVSGTGILKTDSFHHWSKLATPFYTTRDHLKNSDSSNLIYPARSVTNDNKFPANGSDSVVLVDDFAHAILLTSATNTATTWRFVIPLSSFHGTVFSLNQNVMWGTPATMDLTLEDPSKWIYYSTSANDPSAGTPTALANPAILYNFSLNLAVEQDPVIKAQYMERYKTQGINLLVPHVQRLSAGLIAGDTQQIQMSSINSAKAYKIVRILTGAFGAATTGAENLNGSLNNSNVVVPGNATVATRNRILTYRTTLGGIELQNKDLYASPNVQGYAGLPGKTSSGQVDDWAEQKGFFEGTCIFNAGALGWNYCIIDDFTPKENRIKKSYAGIHKDEGLFPGNEPLSYMTSCTVQTGQSNTWYMFAQVLKKVMIRPGELIIA